MTTVWRFGRSSWVGEFSRTPTPVAQACLFCKEPIAAGEDGEVLLGWPGEGTAPVTHALHRECTLRLKVGSVGHQQRRCPCYGGTEEDPPGLSNREAALAAVLFAAGLPAPEPESETADESGPGRQLH